VDSASEDSDQIPFDKIDRAGLGVTLSEMDGDLPDRDDKPIIEDKTSIETEILELYQTLSPEGKKLLVEFASWLKKREMRTNG